MPNISSIDAKFDCTIRTQTCSTAITLPLTAAVLFLLIAAATQPIAFNIYLYSACYII